MAGLAVCLPSPQPPRKEIAAEEEARLRAGRQHVDITWQLPGQQRSGSGVASGKKARGFLSWDVDIHHPPFCWLFHVCAYVERPVGVSGLVVACHKGWV